MQLSLKVYVVIFVLLISFIVLISMAFVSIFQNNRVVENLTSLMYNKMLDNAVEVLKEYVKFERICKTGIWNFKT